jgi:predicted RNA-binding Zn-ribbon protein involved in translation (DUF1610 family)
MKYKDFCPHCDKEILRGTLVRTSPKCPHCDKEVEGIDTPSLREEFYCDMCGSTVVFGSHTGLHLERRSKGDATPSRDRWGLCESCTKKITELLPEEKQ